MAKLTYLATETQSYQRSLRLGMHAFIWVLAPSVPAKHRSLCLSRRYFSVPPNALCLSCGFCLRWIASVGPQVFAVPSANAQHRQWLLASVIAAADAQNLPVYAESADASLGKLLTEHQFAPRDRMSFGDNAVIRAYLRPQRTALHP